MLDERLIIREESENDEEIEEIEESFEDEDNEEEDSLDDNHFREKVRENWRKYSYIDVKKLLKNTNIDQETIHIYCKVALILQAKDYKDSDSPKQSKTLDNQIIILVDEKYENNNNPNY